MERVEHFHSSGPSPEPLRIKVERGQKGGYAFEVSLSGADEAAMVARINGLIDIDYVEIEINMNEFIIKC